MAAVLGLASLGLGGELAVIEVPAAAHAMPNSQAVAISPDGTLVAAGIAGGLGRNPGRRLEGRIHVWETDTGRLVRSLDSLGDVIELAFTHDGRHIARGTVYTPGDSVDADAAQAHAIATGEPLGRMFDRFTFALNPTRPAALVPRSEGICCVYDHLVRPGPDGPDTCRHSVTLQDSGPAHLLACSADGSTFAAVHLVSQPIVGPDAAQLGRRLQLNGLTVGDTTAFLPRRWIISDKLRDCTALALARDGRRLATGHRDGTIRVWSADPLAEIRSWPAGDGVAARPVFSPADDAIAVITQPTVSVRWQRDQAAPGGFAFDTIPAGDECEITIHEGASLDPSKRFKILDGRFRIVHADQPPLAFNPRRLAFSPDGRRLLVGAAGLTLLDRTTGEVLHRFDAD